MNDFAPFPDPLYDRAARLVVAEQTVSLGYLQSRLDIGPERAQGLLHDLVDTWLVEDDGQGGYRVRVPATFYADLDAELTRLDVIWRRS